MQLEEVQRSIREKLGPQYGERRSVSFSDLQLAGVEVSAATVALDGGGEISVSVTNRSEHELSEMVLLDIELQPRGLGCGFTMPVGPGWWQPFDGLADGDSITWNYPVFGSMQWTDFCDRASGVYIGVHDRVPLIKLFSIGRRGGRPWVRVRCTDLRLMPGESLVMPAVVVREHAGGWREGARIYREWAESWMERPTGAEWYDEAPAWCWSGFKGQHAARPERVYADAPDGARKRAEFGVTLTNAGDWTRQGHDAHYPDFEADPQMGGDEGLAQMADALHNSGLRISLYTNGRIADPEGSIGDMPGWRGWAVQGPSRADVPAMQRLHANFDPAADPQVAWNAGSAAVTETYGKVTFAVMCPGSPEWRRLFIERLEKLARDYRADGIFIDQVCGAWALPCYSSDHDHSSPGAAWAGYLDLLRDLRERLRSHNPHFQMSTEGVCDIFGQFFDVQQGHNDWNTQVGATARPMPELYACTFPWYTVNTGFASANNYYYLKLAHAVGSGLDLCDLASDRCEQRFLEMVRTIMRWRRQYARVLRQGEFLGSLECDSPHYLACAFRIDTRMIVTAAWVPYSCEPDRPERVELRLPGGCAGAVRLLTEFGERECRCEGDRILAPVSEIALLEVDLTT